MAGASSRLDTAASTQHTHSSEQRAAHSARRCVLLCVHSEHSTAHSSSEHTASSSEHTAHSAQRTMAGLTSVCLSKPRYRLPPVVGGLGTHSEQQRAQQRTAQLSAQRAAQRHACTQRHACPRHARTRPPAHTRTHTRVTGAPARTHARRQHLWPGQQPWRSPITRARDGSTIRSRRHAHTHAHPCPYKHTHANVKTRVEGQQFLDNFGPIWA